MSEKILVPVLGESIVEATVSKWLKSEGDAVEADEPIVELETDKVNLEVPSPASGVLDKIISKDGSVVEVGATLGSISTNGEVTKKNEVKETKSIEPKVEEKKEELFISPVIEDKKEQDNQNLDVSTPHDIAILALACLNHPNTLKYTSTELIYLGKEYLIQIL